MPKIVDPEARRRAVADAVFRVSARDGLEHASLRNVADEAGLAIGSVRHYFSDHADLMIFAMRELGRRVSERVLAHAERLLNPEPGQTSAHRRDAAERLLGELLPLDESRREEAVLWLTFTTAARTRPRLRPFAEEMDEGIRTVVRRVLTEARRAGGLPSDLDIPLETQRLTALLDGLTLHAVLHPERVTPRTMRAVLRRHLDELARSGRGRRPPSSPRRSARKVPGPPDAR
ncbi:TetR/AcrR family transcriptional regulator [Streptoalloteichus tenebrarius]|uniref:TetR/AcrR family transcriptional regulator n=1 Tax=Streptoalloteichus tenebrarius (strain ATCC 17920 / DSM 40477 / JCM 4838 / CBS 697.72 / NBRC 16177 / NCIMB 11028 / NRRL B-12390 / A12253. 1 / ISP 5477) TaxID=1933 RepID=UPI0020A46D30|nr:TetR/AcrR family transcriptional regulator [Streptoalloteichus tenebrarius]